MARKGKKKNQQTEGDEKSGASQQSQAGPSQQPQAGPSQQPQSSPSQQPPQQTGQMQQQQQQKQKKQKPKGGTDGGGAAQTQPQQQPAQEQGGLRDRRGGDGSGDQQGQRPQQQAWGRRGGTDGGGDAQTPPQQQPVQGHDRRDSESRDSGQGQWQGGGRGRGHDRGRGRGHDRGRGRGRSQDQGRGDEGQYQQQEHGYGSPRREGGRGGGRSHDRGRSQEHQQQPPHVQMPPQGFQQQPPHVQMPPRGFQQQPPHVQMPPPGLQQQPPHVQMPPQRFQQQPPHVQMPPQGFQQQPPHVQMPPRGFQQQPQTVQQVPPGFQQPPGEPSKSLRQPKQQGTISGAPPTKKMAEMKISEPSKQEGGSTDDSALVSQSLIKPGTKGRRIFVESNHLELNLGSLREAIHYDVSIEPDTPKRFLRTVVEYFRQKRFPNRWPAFDGRKNMYTTSPLSGNIYDILDDEITINEDGRDKKFKIQVKFANRVDLTPLRNLLKSPTTPQEALQCVDIVLRSAPVSYCIPVGRSFFLKPEGPILDLGQGMEMYYGFYQSAIRGWKPLLNVDVAHKAFPKNINVIDVVCELLSAGRQEFRREDLRNINQFQEKTITKFLHTLRVSYEIPGQPGSRRCQRVNGLGGIARSASFTHEGRKMTVADYFRTVKKFNLRYPDFPTLWVGKKEREDKILLPIELCTILEGQAVPRKMTEMQTSKMIRYAATDTKERKRKIMNGIQTANYNQNGCVKEFGFSIASAFQKLEARVLQPPVLKYKTDEVYVSRGIWRNSQFINGATINKWTIANVNRYPLRPDDTRNLASLLFRHSRDVGMVIAGNATEPFVNIGPRQDQRSILEYFNSQKGKQFDLIFVIVPDSGPFYSYVKKAAEVNVGCLTQCIKLNTLGRKMNPQTVVNILLKVNSKLNGVNHALATRPPIMKKPVMIMGADVTHPGPGSENIPSVAAVTASHDPNAFKYNICWRLQSPKVEIIEDLENIVIEQLTFFHEKTRCKPEAIVFFRDGVSEGQFTQVKNSEIRAIRSACKKLQRDGYEPKITFVVVQKRHHTRLFPTNPRDSEDKNCNVPAGTCVDTQITHPFMQDFYLVSHASIQGVAKPTKYCTLWDDNQMDNDQVEELAYYLCHMFTRCNRSVSYPAPTYYAHLAAARGKVYIENDTLNMDRLREEFNKFIIRPEIHKDRPMFFV